MTSSIRTWLRTAYVALGASSLYLIWLLAPLVSPTHYTVYHWSGPSYGLFLPPLIDFCAFWLVLTLIFLLARTPGRARRAVWCTTIAFTPWLALNNWADVIGTRLNHVVSVTLFGLAVLTVLVALLLWKPTWEKRFERAVNAVSTLFLLTALSGVVILCEVAWFGWKARSLNAEVARQHVVRSEPTHGKRPRVLWIVFDELSYQQVYERRFPGLQLPAFDALAKQATVFTHTIPAGILTDRVLPSLMTGELVGPVRASPDGGQVSFRNASTGIWQTLDEYDTVFQDAQKRGYRTSIVGWYNPYCRILPDVLDRCFWTYSAPTRDLIYPRERFRSNLMTPLMQFSGGGLGYRVVSLFHRFPAAKNFNTAQHIFDYESLVDVADRILDDHTAEFALIHLPIPHPGGIYDRKAGRLTTNHSSYIDNLALTDKFLGHVRAKLEQSEQWNSSAIIVMGDHSWRLGAFDIDVSALPEEERVASEGGKFDNRPAYVVKLPDEQEGARIDAPFAALRTRRLLDALLSQEIGSAEELSAWVNQKEH